MANVPSGYDVSVNDAAKALGLTRQAIHEMIKVGKIKAIKLDAGNPKVLLFRQDVEKFVSSYKVYKITKSKS